MFFILIQRVDSKVNARLPFLKWAYYFDLLVERVNFLHYKTNELGYTVRCYVTFEEKTVV